MKRTITLFAFLVPILFLLPACGDDDNPVNGGNGDGYTAANAPESLIVRLAEVYTAMDSAAYAALLDSMYIFELDPNSIDPQDPVQWWDLDEELLIAGRMFGSWTNSDGQRVNRITLAIGNITKVVETTHFGPDYPPEDETWYRVTCSVDLRVEVEDPTSQDGVTLFLVASDQEFVVRPDPDDANRWVVFRQYDKEPWNKIAATEESSWGSVKSLFR